MLGERHSEGSMPKAPPDNGYYAYYIMFYQGIGQLFPWNAFITASAYFGARFCTTEFAFDFENYLSIAFTASQTIGLALTLLYGNRYNYNQKIVYPLLIYAGLFFMTTAMVLVKDINPTGLFWLTFFSCVLCGLFGAFLNAGFFSLGAVFPPSYTGAMMSGQGLAGLTVSLSSIITQAAGPMVDGYCSTAEDDGVETCPEYSINYSAFSYFLIATITLLLSVTFFFVLMKLPFTIYNMHVNGEIHDTINEPLLEQASEADTARSSNVSSASASRSESFASSRNSAPAEHDVVENSTSGLHHIISRNERAEGIETGGDYSSPIGQAKSFKESKLVLGDIDQSDSFEGKVAESMGITSLGEIRQVFNIIRTPALSVFFVFTVTIAIFPALTVVSISQQNCQTDERFLNDLFVPFLFVLFNLGDFSGRILAGMYPYFTAENIWIPALCRIIFFPCFLMCNVKGSQIPALFTSDAWPILFMMAFGLSNGYVSSTSMMLGPTLVKPADAPLAGNIMIFCLTAGLMMGSTLSFVVTLISQGHL